MSAVGLATGPGTGDVLVRNLGCLLAAPLRPMAALPVSLKRSRGTGSILPLQAASLFGQGILHS